MSRDLQSLLTEILPDFAVYGECIDIAPFGSGHINNTFISRWDQAGTVLRYTHQRINEKVFVRPDQVMMNINRVTGHIGEKLAACDVKDRGRRVLTVVPSRSGDPWVRDTKGGWWRTYLFIEGTHTLEVAENPTKARVLGSSTALFQKQLSDLGKPRLFESISAFHDMEKRYRRFHAALDKDVCGRAKTVGPEIDYMLKNEERGAVLIRALRDGSLPERICHNDTKMNNILIDDKSGEAICLIDLDTVMPGTCLFDVGDLIRTVTTTAKEDEQDLSLVRVDLEFFSALLDGYLSEAGEFLTEKERELLAESGRNLTQIMGLRFLTDYLEGDVYYHIDYPETNRDRNRNQIALMKSMDAQWEDILAAADSLCERYRQKERP
jgi:hypothetical protein